MIQNMKITADKILKTCMNAQPDESLLIITDTDTDERISKALFSSASEIGCEVLLMKMNPRKYDGQEPPGPVACAMENCDIVIAPTSRSLTHTDARIRSCRKGARIATMPGITADMMASGGLTANYQQISDSAKNLYSKLEKAVTVRVTSDLGTDIEFNVEGCTWMIDNGICHKPGSMTNLPAGEVYVAPADAEGVVVIDGAMGGIGILDDPITIRVEGRRAVAITGKAGDKLCTLVDSVGPSARNIAELGIGINPAAILRGIVLEDEKVAGTVHIALGNNATFGGSVNVELHLDGIIRRPVVYSDDTNLKVHELAGEKYIE